MKTIVDFVARWYLWSIVPLAVIAFLEGSIVVEGLMQGTGLHGYLLDRGGPGPGGDGTLANSLSVWNAFVKAAVSFTLAGVLLTIVLWHERHQRAV